MSTAPNPSNQNKGAMKSHYLNRLDKSTSMLEKVAILTLLNLMSVYQ
ncbi:hypothetical protein [Vibrio sp. RE86]|nr:hypothetical protein [Vibrio sp. RE86]